MVDRKLYKELSRVQEVGKARAGHRRSLTWKSVSEVLPHLRGGVRFSMRLVNQLTASCMPFAGTGKGSAKGKADASKGKGEDREVTFLADEVRNALPQAARDERLVPTLVQQEWDAPVNRFTELDSAGGIAVVHQEYLPQVLRAVGYTVAPTAVVMVQMPAQIGYNAH